MTIHLIQGMVGYVKPTLFLGSSSESVRKGLTKPLVTALSKRFRVHAWNETVFGPGDNTLARLTTVLSSADFAVLFLAPDDAARVRRLDVEIPRDNVIFELGMAMQTLGPKRAFYVIPDPAGSLKLPSDIAGYTALQYDPSHPASTADLARSILDVEKGVAGLVHGKWIQSWKVRSRNFPLDNTSAASVLHYEDGFRAAWVSGKRRYEAVGTVSDRHVTGTWRHQAARPIYTGAFQLFIAENGNTMRGMWCGYNEHNIVKQHAWEWRRSA